MRLPALLLPALFAAPVLAQTPPESQPANEQVIVPEVQRRDVRIPKFPSKDFEVGALVGTYATQSFGASAIAGLRLGYHLSEDFFVETVFAQTKVTDKTFTEIFPGSGPLADTDKKLSYYNVSAGYNIFPGEIFLGGKLAKASSIYLIGGVGSTKFANQRKQTFNVGFGFRVLFSDRWAVRVDMRDHIFSYDLLGVRQNTQNLELTTGIAYYF
ncbi:outer membrane beta-barrel domain-containing protein [uncultured Piscinibacter sp.]|uniref:outer membrane beta-barrel domain-containing protein n=1 Tax=uncultured Piscinibacter sp. TaxID=1131835 RepID=UPI0026158485|nr:outer membrane beta-barrel domain-containing protein [uncultured Piscinibacter sp.]